MENESCNLYLEASASGIEVAWFPLSVEPSMAIQFKDTYAIALDPSKISSSAETNTLLAHELGHCKTGSFYNPYAKLDIRAKHENKADKWAIRHLIPFAKLRSAISDGCTELWALAEYFEVTEDFMAKAIHWYANGNLAHTKKGRPALKNWAAVYSYYAI